MKYKDLRDFIDKLENEEELKRITIEVDPYLEITEVCDRTLKMGGPALLFENPKDSKYPLLANLFGTPRRVALGMGEDSIASLREIGRLLALLKQPDPPKSLRDAWKSLPIFKKVLDMAPKTLNRAPCQEIVIKNNDVDLTQYPLQTCWPDDAQPHGSQTTGPGRDTQRDKGRGTRAVALEGFGGSCRSRHPEDGRRWGARTQPVDVPGRHLEAAERAIGYDRAGVQQQRQVVRSGACGRAVPT